MSIVTWLCNKFGRIVTSIGLLLSGVETFDISAIRDPLEQLTSHKFVLFATVACFALSWIRHQQVASRVGK